MNQSWFNDMLRGVTLQPWPAEKHHHRGELLNWRITESFDHGRASSYVGAAWVCMCDSGGWGDRGATVQQKIGGGEMRWK